MPSSCPKRPSNREALPVGRASSWAFAGGPERNRTSDTRFRKPLLYPLSYGATAILWPAMRPSASQAHLLYRTGIRGSNGTSPQAGLPHRERSGGRQTAAGTEGEAPHAPKACSIPSGHAGPPFPPGPRPRGRPVLWTPVANRRGSTRQRLVVASPDQEPVPSGTAPDWPGAAGLRCAGYPSPPGKSGATADRHTAAAG